MARVALIEEKDCPDLRDLISKIRRARGGGYQFMRHNHPPHPILFSGKFQA
jgi:hypothetical protein